MEIFGWLFGGWLILVFGVLALVQRPRHDDVELELHIVEGDIEDDFLGDAVNARKNR